MSSTFRRRPSSISPVQVLRQSTDSTLEKTVLVFGLARGGTSLIAGVLLELGVFMGHNAHQTKHEYTPLYPGMPKIELLETIRANDRTHSVWGWKCPKDIFHIDQYLHHLRNPHAIIVFRNFLDTSMSSYKHNSIDLLHALRENQPVMEGIISFAIDSEVPTALVSYEKALANPSLFVGGVVNFLQLPTAGKTQLANAVQFSSRGTYSLVSTSTKDPEMAKHKTLSQDYYSGLTLKSKTLAEDSALLTKKIASLSEDLNEARSIAAHLERSILKKGLVTSSDELKDRDVLEALILRGRNVPEPSITLPFLCGQRKPDLLCFLRRCVHTLISPGVSWVSKLSPAWGRASTHHASELVRDLATEALVENERQENKTLRGTYTQLKKDRAESQRFMELLFLLNGESFD
jgi:hypothetical protein